jgi:hypothetical protein
MDKPTIDVSKVFKLIERLDQLNNDLERCKDETIPQQVKHSYYQQKTEELKNFMELFQEAQTGLAQLNGWIDSYYSELFEHWRKDIRWLNLYLHLNRRRPCL